MDYLTAAHRLTGQLAQCTASDPMLRAALDLAVQPWLADVQGSDGMRWGPFAIEVQAVADRLWPGPVTVTVVTDPPQSGADIERATAALVDAVAVVVHDASRIASPLAWEYAAAAEQLRQAILEIG